MTDPTLPMISGALSRLSTADDEGRRRAVNALVALATGEGEEAWTAVVDALPDLPRAAQLSLATPLARRASADPSPALLRGVSWMLTAGPELEAVVFEHYVRAAPELVRPMLASLSRFALDDDDLVSIPYGTARPAGGVRLREVFGGCREALRHCLIDPEPGVCELALRALETLAGAAASSGEARVAPQRAAPPLLVARAPTQWGGQVLALQPRPPFTLAPITQWRRCRQLSFASEGHVRYLAQPDGSNAVAIVTRSTGGAPLGQTPIAAIEPSGRYRDDGTLAVERPSEDRDAYDAHGDLGEIELVRTGQRSPMPPRSTIVAWTGQSLSAVALSPEGSHLAAASHDGELGVFDASTGARQARLVRGARAGTAVVLALDDAATRLVAGRADGRIEVWAPTIGACIAELEVGRPPLGVALSPHGRLLAAAFEDGSVEVWAIAGARLLARVTDLPHAATCVAFSPSGQLLAAAGEGPHARIWDLALVAARFENRTAELLGDPPERLRARLSASCMSGFSGGWQVVLEGDGSCLVVVLRLATPARARLLLQRGKAPGLWEVCLRRKLAPEEAQAFFARCVEADVASKPLPPPRVSRPDEPWVSLTLQSASGARVDFGKPRGVESPGIDPIVKAMSQLVEGFGGQQPEYEGPPRKLEGRVASTPRAARFGASSATGARRASAPVSLWGKGELRSAASSTDGRSLAVGTSLGIFLSDPSTGESRRFLATALPVLRVALSPDGRFVSAATKRVVTRLGVGGRVLGFGLTGWDALTGERLYALESANQDWIAPGIGPKTERRCAWDELAAFDPTGRLLASTTAVEPLHVRDARTGAIVATLHDPRPIEQLVFSPDGAMLVAAVGPSEARRGEPALPAGLVAWDTRDWRRQVLPDLVRPARSALGFAAVAISADGRLATEDANGDIAIHDPREPDRVLRIALPGQGRLALMAFCDAGALVTAQHGDESIRWSEVESGRPLRRERWPHVWIEALTFDAAGDLRVTASEQARSAEPRRTLSLTLDPTGAVVGESSCAEPSPEVRRSASGAMAAESVACVVNRYVSMGDWEDFSVPCDLRLTDAATGELLHSFRGGTDELRDFAFSPDGSLLAAAYDNGNLILRSAEVRVWSTRTGERLQALSAGNCVPGPVRLSPDGRLVAVGAGAVAGTVLVFDVSTGAKVCELRGHTNAIRAIAFHPDGDRLATGGCDATIRLWSLRDGEGAIVGVHNDGDACAVAFTPDGSRLISGGHDGSVRSWGVPDHGVVPAAPPPPGGDERA